MTDGMTAEIIIVNWVWWNFCFADWKILFHATDFFSISLTLKKLALDQIEAEAISNDGQFCKQLCVRSFTSAKHTSLLLPSFKSRQHGDARLDNFSTVWVYLAKVQNMQAYCSILWTKMRPRKSATTVNFVNNCASVVSPVQSIPAYCCLALKAGCTVMQVLSIL